MYTIRFTNEFKRQMKMCERRGYDMELLREASAYFPPKTSCQRNTCPTSYTVTAKGNGNVTFSPTGCLSGNSTIKDLFS